MKKHYLGLVLFTGLALAPAQADPLLIVFDSSTLGGSDGDVLNFFGTITNTTGADVYLNGDSFTLAGFDPSAIDDSPFFANAPLFLGSGGNSGDIGLFNIAIPAAFPDGNYGGTFQILGGVDGDAQDPVGSADFTVQVPLQPSGGVPEPGPAATLSAGLLLVLAARRFAARSC